MGGHFWSNFLKVPLESHLLPREYIKMYRMRGEILDPVFLQEVFIFMMSRFINQSL